VNNFKVDTHSHGEIDLSSAVLATLWEKSLAALHSLRTSLGVMASGQNGFFHAIFGRDSLWTVLLALEAGRQLRGLEVNNLPVSSTVPFASYDDWLHSLARDVLRGLASLQGRAINDTNEEQPGRIIHEYWNPVPHRMLAARWPVIDGRYYGAFDATFLFLITTAQVFTYFHDRDLLEELWPHIQAALLWALAWSDLDNDGLVEYLRRNPDGMGLDNQVWKDSSESIQPRAGETLLHPFAWIEVQGYALAAFAAYIELTETLGHNDPKQFQEIQRRIAGLRQGLDRFWIAGQRFPAIALAGNKKQIEVVSSNPGHLLWSGGLEAEQAQQICQRLLRPDLLTPWGIRTLSETAYYYNPSKYHCGAVWPFDNAVIAAGMMRYGFQDEARHIAHTILQAIHSIDEPVELYVVLPSSWIRSPRITQPYVLVDYYYASSLQAWTAAATLYLVSLHL
jgi:glycogen debranching enzyme